MNHQHKAFWKLVSLLAAGVLVLFALYAFCGCAPEGNKTIAQVGLANATVERLEATMDAAALRVTGAIQASADATTTATLASGRDLKSTIKTTTGLSGWDIALIAAIIGAAVVGLGYLRLLIVKHGYGPQQWAQKEEWRRVAEDAPPTRS